MAWRIRRWGSPFDGGWMEWPAGLIDRLTIVENIYQACASYKNAPPGRSVAWTQQNPQAWQIVSAILAQRKQKRSE